MKVNGVKVCSILMIVIGLACMVMAIGAIVGYQGMDSTMVKDMEFLTGVSIQERIITLRVSAGINIFGIFTGVMGLVFAKKGKLLLCLGGLFLFLILGDGIYEMFITEVTLGAVIALFLKGVVPGLFCYGNFQNIKNGVNA